MNKQNRDRPVDTENNLLIAKRVVAGETGEKGNKSLKSFKQGLNMVRLVI